MGLRGIYVIFPALIVSSCLAGIVIKVPEPIESQLIEATAHVLKRCYGNRVTPVGLAGDSIGMISKVLSSQDSSPVTLIDTARANNQPVSPQSRYKLQVFVVGVSSSTTLGNTLRDIKASIWWNHMATFLIIDLPGSNDGCSNAFEQLWEAWKMNLLNVQLVCYDRSKGRLIYTFNPYTSHAPEPWLFEKTYKGKNNHAWTLFVRGYEEGHKVCGNLDFDKTADLGGYEIRVSVTDASFIYESTKSERACVGLYSEIYCAIIFRALNATPKILVHSSINALGSVDDKGHITGILGEVTQGLSDFGATPRFLTSLTNLSFAYPDQQSELRALTQYRGYKSQLSKIGSVLDITSRVGLAMVCLITILFFKYFVRQTTTVALLNTMRIITDSCLVKVPRKQALRIYLVGLFVFEITIQGIYQGKLASVLTKQEPLRDVETLGDLIKLGHTTYASKTYGLYIRGTELQNRFVALDNITCTEYPLSDPKAACVSSLRNMIFDAGQSNLHMSRKPLFTVPSALPIRPDWPLEQRLNTILMRSVESDQVEISYNSVWRQITRMIETRRNEHIDPKPRVLTLSQLTFAFAILGIGLGCATISFVLEVALHRDRPRSVKPPFPFRH